MRHATVTKLSAHLRKSRQNIVHHRASRSLPKVGKPTSWATGPRARKRFSYIVAVARCRPCCLCCLCCYVAVLLRRFLGHQEAQVTPCWCQVCVATSLCRPSGSPSDAILVLSCSVSAPLLRRFVAILLFLLCCYVVFVAFGSFSKVLRCSGNGGLVLLILLSRY